MARSWSWNVLSILEKVAILIQEVITSVLIGITGTIRCIAMDGKLEIGEVVARMQLMAIHRY